MRYRHLSYREQDSCHYNHRITLFQLLTKGAPVGFNLGKVPSKSVQHVAVLIPFIFLDCFHFPLYFILIISPVFERSPHRKQWPDGPQLTSLVRTLLLLAGRQNSHQNSSIWFINAT